MRYESRNKKLNRQPGTVKNWIYRRGDIYLANLNPFKGSEQGGTRPVLVLSNDIGNFYSSLITIAPITSQLCVRNDRPVCRASTRGDPGIEMGMCLSGYRSAIYRSS